VAQTAQPPELCRHSLVSERFTPRVYVAEMAVEPKRTRSVLEKKGGMKMRKAISELDADQRAALLYVVDLGTALCAAGLIVSLLKSVVDLLLGT